MAQAKQKKRPQQAKRRTAKQKADDALRVKLSQKLAEEIKQHNALAEGIDNAQKELEQRRGRCAMLQEQLEEVGGAVPEIMEAVAPPQPEVSENGAEPPETE